MAKKNSGKQVQRIPVSYDPAEEVEDYAKPLIAAHHTHLVNCKIAYLFKNKKITLKGREVVATSEKVSPKNKVLSGYEFIITVSYPKWKELAEPIRHAVIDHELAHCWVEDDDKTGEKKLKILPHDVEEFGEIIRRHGLYTVTLVKLGNLVSETTKMIQLGDPDSDLSEDDSDPDSDPDSDLDDGDDGDDDMFDLDEEDD